MDSVIKIIELVWTYEYFAIIRDFVGAFALLAAVTKTSKDDTILGYLSRIIDFLGANVFRAKNEEPKDEDAIL